MIRSFTGIKLVLLDIEGTICSISFVKDVLFPYALEALPKVLAEKWDDEDFKQYRDQFPEEVKVSPEALQAHVEDLTKRDVKVAYLKNLQGYLWQSGYENKAYATSLFPDVEPQLQHWRDSSLSLAIFSSGSVFAQKLLFKHVKRLDSDSNESHDLTGLITDWFDTVNAGPKTEASSYQKIADALSTAPKDILFLSDNVKEVRAADEAGMSALVVDRPGNAPLTDANQDEFNVVTSLAHIKIKAGEPVDGSATAKRHTSTANGTSETSEIPHSEPEISHQDRNEGSKKRAAEDQPEAASEKGTKAAKIEGEVVDTVSEE
ncbi:2,3-diketo-5-methylthio-1-phosphopentane phosphatase [Myriangium duriaei CBS 260.36]|uniref:2,3-diketo-5-methylthio-1-phosphopentane phosphatase n=1 Tax=Myriangium duriaei CBS 260.36 TaxID=1168546 RepID=A0A9P4J9F3_9PEZI|nr:2,3-diketo-5-methylthio-1-phosphopentane phosphatase [Myriangium duriaei CBS 260.36]